MSVSGCKDTLWRKWSFMQAISNAFCSVEIHEHRGGVKGKLLA